MRYAHEQPCGYPIVNPATWNPQCPECGSFQPPPPPICECSHSRGYHRIDTPAKKSRCDLCSCPDYREAT